MPLKAMLETLDDVPEAIKGEYEERDGKFYLKVEGGEEVFAQPLKKKNAEILEEKRAIQSKFKPFESFDPEKFKGLTPDQLERALKLLADSDNKNPDPGKRDDATFEELKKKWQAEVDKDKAALQSTIDGLNAELRRYKLEFKARDAALKAGVFEEDIDDVIKLTSHRFDLDKSDSPVVLDKDGDPTSISLESFFKDVFKAEKPKFYKGNNAGGSGASPGTNGGRPRGKDLSALPARQRLTEARRLAAK